MPDIKAGDVFEVKYPFVLEKYPEYGLDGANDRTEEWFPGFRLMDDEDSHSQSARTMYAHGEGKAVYTVISTHKPGGRYPPRVFYTRHWITPDGTEIKGKGLRCHSIKKFKRDAAIYAYSDRVEIMDYEDTV